MFTKNPFRFSRWGWTQEKKDAESPSRFQGWEWLRNRDFFKWSFQFPWTAQEEDGRSAPPRRK